MVVVVVVVVVAVRAGGRKKERIRTGGCGGDGPEAWSFPCRWRQDALAVGDASRTNCWTCRAGRWILRAGQQRLCSRMRERGKQRKEEYSAMAGSRTRLLRREGGRNKARAAGGESNTRRLRREGERNEAEPGAQQGRGR